MFRTSFVLLKKIIIFEYLSILIWISHYIFLSYQGLLDESLDQEEMMQN